MSLVFVTAAEEMAALVADFPEYDEELLKCMLEDQSGDVLETRAVLRVRLHLHCKHASHPHTVLPAASLPLLRDSELLWPADEGLR